MSLAESAALAFVMGQHITEEKDRTMPEIKVEVTMVPRVSKKQLRFQEEQASIARQLRLSAERPIQGSTVTKDVAPTVVAPFFPKLDAKGFLSAMRGAKTREERIAILEAYNGYNHAENYGSQLLVAEMKAKRELRGAPLGGIDREEQRAAYRSATGFVAGLPDNAKRRLDNLLAQEKKHAEDLIQHDKDSQDMKRTAEERTLSAGLAKFERDRLSNIRADLKALGFEVA